MMGVLINPSSNSLPIIHVRDYRAFYGIMTGIGLFSDSIHFIRSAFAPLELVFFRILLSLHSHCLFFLCFFPSFYSDLDPLGNEESLNSLFKISND